MLKEKLYKFVAFTADERLNAKKLEMIAKHQFWASCYDYFEDDREVLRPYDGDRVQVETGKTKRRTGCFLFYGE